MTTDKSRRTPESLPPRPGELLARTIAAVAPASVWAAEEANALQVRLTTPGGSLEQVGLAAGGGVRHLAAGGFRLVRGGGVGRHARGARSAGAA